MAALDFPASPTLNQTYTANGLTWKWDGASWVTQNAGLTGTVQVSEGGTGTTTQFTLGSVLFAGASGVYSQDNSNFFWDDINNRLGIGTASPDQSLVVNGNIQSGTTGNNGNLYLGGPNVSLRSAYASNILGIYTNNTEVVRVDASGNFGIGVAPSYKLDVNGSGRVSGQLSVNSAPASNIQFRIGGTVVSGSNTSYVNYADPTIPSTTTTGAFIFSTYPSTQAASFVCGNLTHFLAYPGVIGAGSSITNQYGFNCADMTGAGSNYGFYSGISAGTNRWGFYSAGTANNYFNGSVGIGTNAPRAQLELSLAAFLSSDGGYFGGGAYYSSGWKNAVASQGGWVIRNNAGTFSIWTGPSPGASANAALTLTQRMYIDGDGIIGINGTLRNAGNSGNFLYDAYASDFTLRNHGFFDGRIEVNNSGTGNRWAYIDFHGDDTYTDYSLRLLRSNGGVNAGSELSHRGTGALVIQTVDAGAMYLKTAGVSRITLAADGASVTFAPIIIGKSNAATFVDANDTGSISVRGDGTYAATMSFHRVGTYAVNFGLDTDNFLKVGGWSMGAVKYKIVYETGSWGISITGSSASCTGLAATATKAAQLAQHGVLNNPGMTFNWVGQSGQPTWLWGGNDGSNMYVYNPSNFSVNYATTAGSATTAGAGTVRVWVRFSGTTISNHANMTSITVYSGTIYNINFAITLANTTYCTQFTINEGATYTTRYAGIIGDQNTTYCRAYTYGFAPTGAIAIIY